MNSWKESLRRLLRPAPQEKPGKWDGVWRRLGILAALGASPTLLGFFGGAWWFLDLFAHFRIYYAFGFLLAFAFFLSLYRWRTASLCGMVFLINGMCIAPLYFSGPATPATRATELKILQFNVLSSNPRQQDVLTYIRQTNAHLILLLEVTPKWMDELKNIAPGYALVQVEARRDNFGIALWSRIPVSESSIFLHRTTGLPSVIATVQLDGRILTFFGTHLLPPMSAAGTFNRNTQLAEIAQWVASRTESVVVAGDLNATPWSYPFRNFQAETDLLSSQNGFGYQATWPERGSLLRIPIDHLLHSSELTTIARQVGPDLGSDHLPLVTTLKWKAAAAKRP